MDKIKLCPFRKKQTMDDSVNTYPNIVVTSWEEAFLPCLKEECMAYETDHPFFDNYEREYCKAMRK